MLSRLKSRWLNMSQSLGFVPFVVAGLFAVLGIALVEFDSRLDLTGIKLVFTGDGSAARTVLSVIAGSLITVAGLTFSITMVVLQLAASQFTPRILRTFFGDRLTQITIGTYVGIFIYSILVLRAVGSLDQHGFVPRLSVTVAALFSIAAVLLLVAFLHHVSKMVQVSEVSAQIARAGLGKIEQIYPRSLTDAPVPGSVAPEGKRDADAGTGPDKPPGFIFAPRPGYVQRVSLPDLVKKLAGPAARAEVLICPGDFVSSEQPLVALWPAGAVPDCSAAVLATITIASECDLDQDVAFALRQLTDMALKAMSPGINDPMTAVTCIGYLRSMLVMLAGRPDLPDRIHGDDGFVALARRRSYTEFLESSLLQINRYVGGDAWVCGEMLAALTACAAAAAPGFAARLRDIEQIGLAMSEQTLAQAGNARDRESIMARRAELQRACQ